MKNKNTFFFLLFFFSSIHLIFSQRDNTYTLDASAIIGTSQTPFWMRANKFGKAPTEGQTLAIFAGLKSDYQNPEKKVDWGYGLNIGGFAGFQNKAIIQQAYAKAKWRVFEFYAGRREEIQGLVDTTLSSGSYIWSGNALPMPKIDISIPEYTSIGPSGVFSIKGNYAHGWFDRKRDDAVGVMLHQKSGYFRIGKSNWKFKAYAGLNHQVQYGGKIQFDDPNGYYSKGGRFGSSFRDYIYLVTGRSAVGEDTAKFSGSGETLNRVGNHLGTMDIALEFKHKNGKVFFYRQNIFEDGSLYYLNNITDGLNGLSISFNDNNSEKVFNVKKIVIEFLNTQNQGGLFYDDPRLPGIRGYDQYFNNTQFRDGWSYQKTSLGTPFIMSKNEFPQLISKPNPSKLMFTNNRIQAYYFGLEGNILNKNYITGRLSFTKNWGMFGIDFANEKFQTSFSLNSNQYFPTILGGVNGYVNLAGDFGELLNQNFAIQLGLKKSFGFLPFLHKTHSHF